MTAVADPGTPVSPAPTFGASRIFEAATAGPRRTEPRGEVSVPAPDEQLVAEHDSHRRAFAAATGAAVAAGEPNNAGTPAHITASAAPSRRKPVTLRAPFSQLDLGHYQTRARLPNGPWGG